MKVLVFSDSHGNIHHMQAALDAEKPDLALHLGDLTADVARLARDNPELPIHNVCGNCDGSYAQPEERTLELLGHRVFMTHGHLYHVKSGTALAERAAMERRAELLLFGHTHVPLVDRRGPLWVMNPGTIRGWGLTTYGVVTLDEGALDCKIVAL